jgi:hypothetical protein
MRTGEDTDELEANQSQQDQQVNPQGPQGEPDHRGGFDACHKSIRSGVKLGEMQQLKRFEAGRFVGDVVRGIIHGWFS